jgi:hypothetical protein
VFRSLARRQQPPWRQRVSLQLATSIAQVSSLFANSGAEPNGTDLRRELIEVRKATLANLLHSYLPGLRLNEHLAHAGDLVFRRACALGSEGIVSKRLGSRYRSGRTKDWLKFKNPDAPAVKREAEEDWVKGAAMG